MVWASCWQTWETARRDSCTAAEESARRWTPYRKQEYRSQFVRDSVRVDKKMFESPVPGSFMGDIAVAKVHIDDADLIAKSNLAGLEILQGAPNGRRPSHEKAPWHLFLVVQCLLYPRKITLKYVRITEISKSTLELFRFGEWKKRICWTGFYQRRLLHGSIWFKVGSIWPCLFSTVQ